MKQCCVCGPEPIESQGNTHGNAKRDKRANEYASLRAQSKARQSIVREDREAIERDRVIDTRTKGESERERETEKGIVTEYERERDI